MRRLTACLPLLAVGLWCPSAADAAYDLTVASGPTVNATLTATSASSSRLTATGPGARIDAAELTAAVARGTVLVTASAAGSQAGDVTVASPVTPGRGRIAVSPDLPGTVRLQAPVDVGALDVGGTPGVGGPVEIATPAVAASEQLSFGRPLRLAGDTTLRAAVVSVQEGARGPFGLTLQAGTSLAWGGLGTATEPLASVRVTGQADLRGDVRTTGQQRFEGAWLSRDVTLATTAGDIRLGGPVQQGGGTNRGYALTVTAGGTVQLPGVGAEPGTGTRVGSVSVTGGTIALSGEVATSGAQTYAGPVTAADGTVLRATRVTVGDALRAAPGGRVAFDTTSASVLAGPLRGDAGSAVELGGSGDYGLTATAASDPVLLALATTGRTDVTGSYPDTPVALATGTLGGTGRTGVVSAAAGSRLDPGLAGTPGAATLTVGGLSLAAGAAVHLDAAGGTTPLDRLRALGPVTLAGAVLELPGGGDEWLPRGAAATLVDQAGSQAVDGTFTGRSEGAEVAVGTAAATLTYAGGDGNDVVLRRARATGAVTLQPAAAEAPHGAPVPLAAHVTPADATGTVTFRDGDRVLGTAAVVAGTATLTATDLAPGPHALTATYDGDAGTTPATSSTSTVTVAAPGSTGPSPGDGGPGDGGPGDGAVPPPGPLRPDPTPPGASTPDAPRGSGPSIPPADDAAVTVAPKSVRAALRELRAVRATAGGLRFRQRFLVAGAARWRLTLPDGRLLATTAASVARGRGPVTLRLTSRARRLLTSTKGTRLVLRTRLVVADGRRVTATVVLRRPALWRR